MKISMKNFFIIILVFLQINTIICAQKIIRGELGARISSSDYNFEIQNKSGKDIQIIITSQAETNLVNPVNIPAIIPALSFRAIMDPIQDPFHIKILTLGSGGATSEYLVTAKRGQTVFVVFENGILKPQEPFSVIVASNGTVVKTTDSGLNLMTNISSNAISLEKSAANIVQSNAEPFVETEKIDFDSYIDPKTGKMVKTSVSISGRQQEPVLNVALPIASNSDQFDPYATLGIEKTATTQDIKNAFLAKMRQLTKYREQSSVDLDTMAADNMIAQAYSLLTNPARRQAYDQKH